MKRIRRRRWRKRRRQYGGLLDIGRKRLLGKKLPKNAVRMALNPAYAEQIFMDAYVNDRLF